MNPTHAPIQDETARWLLDESDPGARYLALRDLFRLPPGDPELEAARHAAHTAGPIAAILEAMHPDGYWVEPGPGYLPKYTSTVWSIVTLAQLGACISMDGRIAVACDYLLAHSLAPGGQFGSSTAPSGTADCLQGNLCAALLDLGAPPQRLEAAFDWMARTVTGEGIAPVGDKSAARRYYAGKCGPLFACGANDRKSCAWGGVKVMLALSKWPVERRTGVMQRAIQAGAEFFLSTDPATAAYPSGYAEKPSGNWWKFGFPVFYISDILQIVEALAALGFGRDPRLAGALQLVRAKQNPDGSWPLEYDYSGKTWVDFGKKKASNRWVTLRALRTLQALEASPPGRHSPAA